MFRQPTAALVICSFVCTALSLSCNLNLSGRLLGQETKSEIWFGTLETPLRHFRFALHLEEREGAWQGNLKSMDEGNREFPLDELARNKEEFEFLIRASKGRFKGQFGSKGDVIEGNWIQAGQELPLVFKQVEAIPKQNLAALWQGTINLVIQKLDVQFREFESGDVLFDSVSQKAGGFVANKTEKDGEITFDVPAVKGQFVGSLNEDGQQLEGKWKQGLLSPKLVLKKMDVEAVDEAKPPARPQTPQAPFPYSIQEVAFENSDADVKLAGTLTIPQGDREHYPAVILVSGSGPQDRDESIAGHRPFWVIADYFSRRGIAVLRFDDRGVGGSSGDFAAATSEDFASDVQAAFEFLSTQAKIDANNIGICGHSEGGLIAPMVAAENERVRFVILMAGPGVNGEKILKSQALLILEASGADPATVQQETAAQAAFISLAKQQPNLAEDEFVRRAKQLVAEIMPAEELTDEVDSSIQAASKQLLSPWMQYFMRYEPSASLSRLQCAVLAINGEKDLQVDPKLNLPEIRKALQTAPTKDFEILELPKLNHLFQTCERGTLDEYGDLEETFSESALQVMVEWIQQHTSES